MNQHNEYAQPDLFGEYDALEADFEKWKRDFPKEAADMEEDDLLDEMDYFERELYFINQNIREAKKCIRNGSCDVSVFAMFEKDKKDLLREKAEWKRLRKHVEELKKLVPHDKLVALQLLVFKRGFTIAETAESTGLPQLLLNELQNNAMILFCDSLQNISFNEKTVLVSGKFTVTRSALKRKIIEAGAVFKDVYTPKADILIVGEKPSRSWIPGFFGDKIIRTAQQRLFKPNPIVVSEKLALQVLFNQKNKDDENVLFC